MTTDITISKEMKHIEWKIKNFFELPTDVDNELESDCFFFSEAMWYLSMYPNGQTEHKSDGWIGLYIMKTKSTDEYSITCELGIKNTDGTEISAKEWNKTFHKGVTGWGSSKLVEKSKLLSSKSDVALDGTLTVFCNLQNKNIRLIASSTKDSESQTHSDDLSPLSDDLKNIYINKRCTDVTLIVKNEEFPVHRAILVARSPVFASMFEHDMSEKNGGTVEISDCDPSSFKNFLFYLYTGRLDNLSLQTAINLFKTADKYDVKAVKDKCVHFMRQDLSVDLVCDVTHLAVMYRESDLFTDATNFFMDNAEAILSTEKWLQFLEENTSLGNELLLKLVKSKN